MAFGLAFQTVAWVAATAELPSHRHVALAASGPLGS